MPTGDKGKYTEKQKRQAQHIEEGYEERGTPEKEAKQRAWATVNKETGGGKKSGSGRGKTVSTSSARKGGAKGSASQSTAKRSAAGRKAAATRTRSAATKRPRSVSTAKKRASPKKRAESQQSS